MLPETILYSFIFLLTRLGDVHNMKLGETLGKTILMDPSSFQPDADSQQLDKRLSLETSEPTKTPCINDRLCGKHKFCDKHFGVCRPRQTEGEMCRKHNHCIKSNECVFGRCRPVLKAPALGARCRNDRDCGDDACCARQHGEKVCQARPRAGQRCYVPLGGLQYALNEQCSCAGSLVCQAVARRKHRRRHIKRSENSSVQRVRVDDFRCAPPS